MRYLKSITLILCLVFLFAISVEAAQCQAITKKGTQCKRQAQQDSRYCWQHVKKVHPGSTPPPARSAQPRPVQPQPGRAPASSSLHKEHIVWGYPLPYKQLLERIGYTASHDPSWKIPHWVSYHVTAQYVNAPKLVERKFKPDPDLPVGQRAELSDYKNSGYDRGHLARQADMRGRNKQCELEACYLSNIAPQKPSYNRKIWLRLEDKVQDWAKRYGEVWVITGPVFVNGQVNKTIGGNKVAVPGYFYKIVVRQDGNMPKVLAFIIGQDAPLNSNTKLLTPFLVSVDKVEGLTCLDFLHELPDSIEDSLEAAVPTRLWSLN